MHILNISFEKVALEELKDLRELYLQQLTEAQEYYVEEKVQLATCMKIIHNKVDIGYIILEKESTLLEYYVIEDFVYKTAEIFNLLIEVRGIRNIICKSFDQSLLALCLQNKYQYQVIGVLFRKTIEDKLDYSENLIIRDAIDDDIKSIMEINENVFSDEEELKKYVKNKSIVIFEKFDELIGVGIYTPIFDDKPNTDIGILINRQFRNRGYGTQIIKYLHNLCIENSMIPQCGCAYTNNSSRRAIEKAGYIATHRVIEFRV